MNIYLYIYIYSNFHLEVIWPILQCQNNVVACDGRQDVQAGLKT